MSAHTEGRIEFRPNGDANSYALLDDRGRWWMNVLMNGEMMTARQEADLRRLAACWNAFDNYSTNDVEMIAKAGGVQDIHRTYIQATSRVCAENTAARMLLRELIEIEGSQPGTAGWAERVRAFLAGGAA